MRKKDRYQKFVEYFETHMPDPETELVYDDPYQLLVAVILSAQCTDKRVNLTTPAIFERFPSPQDLALALFEEVFALIKSISFPNNKAKHLIGMAKMLVEEYSCQVPSEVDKLQKLPGVGRKTANVIASVIFQQPTMAVDTHVFRVSKRIGLVDSKAKTPLEVEKQLVKYIRQDLIHKSHHWLILHGRYVCIARKPKCEVCGLTDVCNFFVIQKKLTNLSIGQKMLDVTETRL